MLTLRSILARAREAVLYCAGSPHSRTRQLAALRKLDAHLLKDIGLTADEARRSFSLPDQAEGRPRYTAVGRFSWNR